MSGALFAIARLGIELDKCTPVLMKAISSFVQMQEEQFDPISLSLLIRSLGELKFRWNLFPEELYSLVRASPFMSNDAKVIKKKVVSLLHLHLNSCPKNSFINILRGCAVLGLTWREFVKFGLLNEMIRMMHNKLSEDQFYRNPSEVITVLSALVRLQNNSMRYKSQYGNNAPSELGELRSFLASLRKGIAAFEQEGKWGDRERSTVASLWKELDLL